MNTVQERKEYSISVMEMLTLVKRHLIMILAAGLIGGFLTFTVCSLFVAPVYKASAKMIVNSGIVRVVYQEGYPDEFSVEILKEGGVLLERYTAEESAE